MLSIKVLLLWLLLTALGCSLLMFAYDNTIKAFSVNIIVAIIGLIFFIPMQLFRRNNNGRIHRKSS